MIVRRFTDVLRNNLGTGDIVSVEPGLYDKRLGGIRIEDMVVVRETHCERLGTLDEIIEIEDKLYF